MTTYVHVMQLDDGDSEASFAYVHWPPHNQPYIFTTVTYICKANTVHTVDWAPLP